MVNTKLILYPYENETFVNKYNVLQNTQNDAKVLTKC